MSNNLIEKVSSVTRELTDKCINLRNELRSNSEIQDMPFGYVDNLLSSIDVILVDVDYVEKIVKYK